MQTFNELTLSAPLVRAIADLGYEKPSPIQAEALPILLGDATDFLGLAATGTGKTAAFAIPLLEKLDTSLRAVQAVILCPTRELALQVSQQIDLLGKHMGVHALPIYGGAGYNDQLRGLKKGAQIVVGTPGRIIDHLNRGTLKLDNLHTLILDEADEMISMGFKEDLEAVLEKTPREDSNIWLFSATMSREVRKVADVYLRSPKQVQVNRTEMLPTTIEQLYYMVRENQKAEVLCKLIEAAENMYGLIFCQTKSLVIELTQYLTDRGYRVDCLHGDKSQEAREKTMKSFRDKRLSLLVCTDVASRGLDVKDVTHVINFSIPRELDNYVHRIGRTGRSGKTGVAMSLVTPSHRDLILRIEKMTKSKMVQGKIPTQKELTVKKLAELRGRFDAHTDVTKVTALLDEAWLLSLAFMEPQEIASRFLALLNPDLLKEEEKPVREIQYRDDRQDRRSDSRPRPNANRRDYRERDRRAPDQGPSRLRFKDRPTVSAKGGGGTISPRRKDETAKVEARKDETRKRPKFGRDRQEIQA